MKGFGVYKIEYYGVHSRGGWSITLQDNVLAKSDTEALNKFYKKHPEIKSATVIDWVLINY